ncbi:MAG: ATP-binding protein [bacterium]
MPRSSHKVTTALDRHAGAIVTGLVAVAVIIVTWIGIDSSRSHSLRLLQQQGRALVESLAQSAQGAIAAEISIDYLVGLRYSDILRQLTRTESDRIDEQLLMQLIMDHDLDALHILDRDGEVLATSALRTSFSDPPDFVQTEATALLANPEQRYTLLLDDDRPTDGAVHYYLEISNDLNFVVVLVAEANYYVEALTRSQIGYLAQKISGQAGVEYLLYQSTDGIIFASRQVDNTPAIESDAFLSTAIESDTVAFRTYIFQDREVLEVVRPFSSADYPFGILRLGLALDGYHQVVRGFDRLLIGLSAALFAMVLAVILYLNTRRRRREISHRYDQIKSVTDTVFEQMRTGVAVVSRDGSITLANPAFERAFGMTALVGSHWDQVVGQPDFGSLADPHAPSSEMEINAVVAGEQRVVLLAVSRLGEDSPGSPLVAVVSDVTRLRRYEQEVARKQRLSEMGNLAAGVAHEIRNPLNAISIAAQRLAAEFEPKSDRQQYQTITHQVREETRRLNVIITRFLALARDQKQPHQKVPVDETLADLIELLRAEANQLGISLEYECRPGLAVASDADSLRRIVINLFNNSKEAMAGRPGCIRIGISSEAGAVHMVFSDDGPGIPEAVREEVFKPFYTTKESGTGLGLSTVHRAVVDMGGTVEVGASDTGGAEFRISIPMVV